MSRKPKSLKKVEEEEPLNLIKSGPMAGIPLEFILITIIMVSVFVLIIVLMGRCVESGLLYNNHTGLW